jgi:hypothetical protein
VEERFPPTQENEQNYRSELVKWGIEFEKAFKVARILALRISNENLTSSEVELVEEVCQEWFEKRKQWEQFKRVTAEHSPSLQQPTWENYQTAAQRRQKDSSTTSGSNEKG